MHRLLKRRTWRIRGNNAAEASMIVAAAALLVPILLFVGAGALAYREIERQAEERIARTLELLYNNIRTTFESEYLVATSVAELLDDYATNADICANEQTLHDRLRQFVGALPQVEDVWVLDEDGRPLVAAKVFPLPAGLSNADRAYFTALRGGEPRAISELSHGRANNIDFFQYSERRQKPDGSFNGAIAISISPSYFTKQFACASDAQHFTAALIRADGEILARYPGVGPGNKPGPKTGFIRTTKAQPLEGGYTIGSGVIDGVERIIRYRKIPDLPNAHLDDAYAAANVEVTPGQYVLIAVSDTGTGMDQETVARSFEPFFTTKQRGHGTGLGLSMTFGYVKQVGGHLKIYSGVGQARQ